MRFAQRTTLALTLTAVLLLLRLHPPTANAQQLPNDPSACLSLARDTVDLEPNVVQWRNSTFNTAKQTGNFRPLLEPDSIRVSVGNSTDDDSLWTTTPNDGRVWCLEIKTATHNGESKTGALQLVFDTFILPRHPDAEMEIYDDQQQEPIGPYDSGDNDNDGFITSEVCFENCGTDRKSLIVAYYEPPGASSKFSIPEVIHGFTNPSDFGESLFCNLNASVAPSCITSRPWASEIRASVQVVQVNFAGGRRFNGSGVLINNTAEDLTTYVLSADHVLLDPEGTLLNNFGNLNFFRINYQSDRCGTGMPPQKPSYEVITGGEVVADSSLGDFVLVKLPVKIPQSYKAHFIGWNRGGALPQEGTVIGHPKGDVKKISFANHVSEYSSGDWQADFDGTNDGAIEKNHSGSPFLDENRRVVGHVSFQIGPLGCNASAGMPKFSKNWNRGLSQFLDPGATGQTSIPSVAGYDLTVENKSFTDPETDFASGFFRTAGRIDAENVTVQSSGRLTLRARAGMRIEGPFLAQAGSDFKALIDDGPTLTELGIPETYQPPPSAPTVAGGSGQSSKSESTASTSGKSSSSKASKSDMPTQVTLSPNYPNPFRKQTVIRYSLPEATHVRLTVYNLLGQRIAVLVNGQQRAGFQHVTWKATALPGGMYFYRLKASGKTLTESMTLIR